MTDADTQTDELPPPVEDSPPAQAPPKGDPWQALMFLDEQTADIEAKRSVTLGIINALQTLGGVLEQYVGPPPQ